MSLQDSDSRLIHQGTNRQNGPAPESHHTQATEERQKSSQDIEPHQAQATNYEKTFHQLTVALKAELKRELTIPNKHSHFKFAVVGENSQFTRFNHAKVRQSGQVCDGQMMLTLISAPAPKTDSESTSGNSRQPGAKTTTISLPFLGKFETDWQTLQPTLNDLQKELLELPVDPYVVLPSANANRSKANHSRECHIGNLLPTTQLTETLLSPVQSLDFSGLYAGGYAYRGYADSAGKQHWFETPSFTLDYSLFAIDGTAEAAANTAVKGTLAGRQWEQSHYLKTIAEAKKQLNRATTARRKIPRGHYRTYLAPAAVAEIIDTIGDGGGLGEAALRQGRSAFSRLESGSAKLSSQFSLGEDFQQSGCPRFNSDGEIAPAQLPVIVNGQWVRALVNGRSEKEYGKPSNGANQAEALRAASVAPGNLAEKNILSALDTGLYVSNLHYLNWSDLTAGHITGMTRYACFWVENGEIVAPIENLRFDDDLYRFLGEGLVALTDQQTFIPAVGTYDHRSLGGMWVPGMLIEAFRYTL